MPAVTYNFLPEGGTLASGVRAPTALTQGGVSGYINLDPEGIATDVADEAGVLPDSDTPAWTKLGTVAATSSGGILNIPDASAVDRALYRRIEAGLVSTSPAYLAFRLRLNSTSSKYGNAVVPHVASWNVIRDNARGMSLAVDEDGTWLLESSGGDNTGAGLKMSTSGYHIYELWKVKAADWRLYVDGRFVTSIDFGDGATATETDFLFGSQTGNLVDVDYDWVHYKITTLLPATSPTADFVFDSGVAGTVWDMSTILMLENLYGEAGNVKYKYGAGETTTPTLNGSFLTAANLALEVDPTGRYFRLNVQLNGDGSQDAGWGGMQIGATTRRQVARALGRGLAG